MPMRSGLSRQQRKLRSKYLAIANAEVISLISEGYRLIVRGPIDSNTEYTRLYHFGNRNTIVIKASSSGFCMAKNGKIIKELEE